MNYDSCKMRKVESIQAVREGAPGSFFIATDSLDGEEYKLLWMMLPDGTSCAAALEPAPKSIPAVWKWNYNENKPTLTNGINLRGRWCGKIQNGHMVSTEKPPAVPAVNPRPKPTPEQLPKPNLVRDAVKRGRRAR